MKVKLHINQLEVDESLLQDGGKQRMQDELIAGITNCLYDDIDTVGLVNRHQDQISTQVESESSTAGADSAAQQIGRALAQVVSQ